MTTVSGAMMKKVKIEKSVWRLVECGRLFVRTSATCPRTGKVKVKKAILEHGAELAQARQKIRELKREITEVRAEFNPSARQSLREYAEQWLSTKTPELRPSTAQTYKYGLGALCDFMGAVPIGDVVRGDIGAWARWLETLDKGNGEVYATATLRQYWRVARTMLRDAEADGLLDNDPTHRIRPPSTSLSNVREEGTLSFAELGALVDAAWQHVPGRAAEITMLAYTGMRPGELHALKWGDIDWEHSRIDIRRAVSEGTLVDSTKTKADRETYMPDIVGWGLLRHIGDRAIDPEALIFPSDVGTPRRRGALAKPMRKAAEKAGIEQTVSPQVLRRTYDTLLISLGVDRIVLRSMIGHSSEEMTELYAGVRMEDKRRAGLRLIRGGG